METAFIYAITAAITWGLVYTIDQKILTGVAPRTLLFIDSVVTAVMLVPFILLSKASIRQALVTNQVSWPLIVFAAILAGLANFLIFSGIKSLKASTASVIEITYPFFVVLFTYLLFHSIPNLYFFVGGVVVFIGSIVVIKFT